MQAISPQYSVSQSVSVVEGSTNFISRTELGICRTPMFVFTLSGSHFDLTLTHGVGGQ